VQKFSEGWTSIKDEHRVGRPVEIATPATLQHIEDIIQADRRVTIDAVATAILLLLLLLLVRAQGICPRCTAACRLIVLL
jgi:hypothetical protein